jgi:hypothetical protein
MTSPFRGGDESVRDEMSTLNPAPPFEKRMRPRSGVRSLRHHWILCGAMSLCLSSIARSPHHVTRPQEDMSSRTAARDASAFPGETSTQSPSGVTRILVA